MFKFEDTKHSMEIHLQGKSQTKRATYVVFLASTELSVDNKFFHSMGWDGLDNEGTCGDISEGESEDSKSEMDFKHVIVDLKEYLGFEGRKTQAECDETFYIFQKKLVEISQ
jgi:hypothetical protein